VSNPQAIAAVTATLHHLLLQEFNEGGTAVTVQPPDRARGTNTGQQLNVFLYHIEFSGAWRNRGMPGQTLPSEPGVPPLGLNLYYLLTAYGRSDDDLTGHQVLGRAMRVLHDHPVLGRDEIKNALTGNDLGEQVERVRITHQPMSLEETSKIWTAFQTNYRLSTAYQAAVVLIDSQVPSRTPLPVIVRKIFVWPNLLPPFPALFEAVPPANQPSASLNDKVTLSGVHLDGTNPTVRIQHRRWTDPFDIAPEPGATDSELEFKIHGNPPEGWLAGTYTVAVSVQRPDEPFARVTNDVTLSLAPTITSIVPPTVQIVGGKATVGIHILPGALTEQHPKLLLGGREIALSTEANNGTNLGFTVVDAVPGEYFVRIRVDGVDTLLIIDRDTKTPHFDSDQKVVLQ
jgi:hypothetical protein